MRQDVEETLLCTGLLERQFQSDQQQVLDYSSKAILN
jgi:hypothetical protein